MRITTIFLFLLAFATGLAAQVPRLFKGKTVVGQEFTVTENKTALSALVEAIVGEGARANEVITNKHIQP